MTRACSICTLPLEVRRLVDEELVCRAPYRTIAHTYGVSRYALMRHAKEHLPATLAKGHEAEVRADADKLLRNLEGLHGRTLRLLKGAEDEGEVHTALRAIREARGNLELLARLVGELAHERPVLNIYIGEVVQQAIINALDPYPQAGMAVANALAAIESENGDER